MTTFSNPRLAERLKAHSFSADLPSVDVDPARVVVLGPASQIEIVANEMSCWIPFVGAQPDEHWLRLFRETSSDWPSRLAEPQIDEGRGIWLGPLPVDELDEYASALKRRVGDVNLDYQRDVAPELLRQHEEALRLESERKQLRAHVEGQLRELFG